MDLFVVNTILGVIIIILFILLSWFWPPDSPWAPFWSTPKEKARAFCKLAKVGKKDVVYELGCGNATALIVAAKEFGAKGVGIEIDPLRYVIAKISVRLNGASSRVTILRKNFFNVDFSPATIVYAYLVPKALNRLKPKFKKELKKGTKIVSYKYEMSQKYVLKDQKSYMFLYKV